VGAGKQERRASLHPPQNIPLPPAITSQAGLEGPASSLQLMTRVAQGLSSTPVCCLLWNQTRDYDRNSVGSGVWKITIQVLHILLTRDMTLEEVPVSGQRLRCCPWARIPDEVLPGEAGRRKGSRIETGRSQARVRF